MDLQGNRKKAVVRSLCHCTSALDALSLHICPTSLQFAIMLEISQGLQAEFKCLDRTVFLNEASLLLASD